MNKFCVGQKVIDCFNDRKLLTVVKTFESGQIELENGVITYSDRVQCQASFLDKTNFFYHHSKWGIGVEKANDGLRRYLMVLDDIDDMPNAKRFLMPLLEKYASQIEQGYAIMRTSELNMLQWGHTFTLDHHFPFLNPENVTDY